MENTQGSNGAEVIKEPLGTMSDSQVEEAIQAKGLTAPRLTPDHIKSVIVAEEYVLLPETTTTICYLILANGFVVTGESACVSVANFDQAIGCQVAYNNAVAKVWQLEGYLLKQRLHEEAETALTDEQAQELFNRMAAHTIGASTESTTTLQSAGISYRFLRQELVQWLLPLREPQKPDEPAHHPV